VKYLTVEGQETGSMCPGQETILETEHITAQETDMVIDLLLAQTRDNPTITRKETTIKNPIILARTETEIGTRNRDAEMVLLKLRDSLGKEL
jgi:hypothetical protein